MSDQLLESLPPASPLTGAELLYTVQSGLDCKATAAQIAVLSAAAAAPTDAEYITSTPSATLSAERVLTDTATITWDFSTAGQAKANTAVGGGNVSSVGTPVNGQLAQWTTSTTIQGVDVSSLGLAPLASPVFTGDPQAPTPLAADNDTSIATTAFVKAQGLVPTGGTTGQVLAKNSATNFDTGWITASSGGGGFTASSTPPASPIPGDHWYDLSTGILSIYINDGTSSQWVQVSPPMAASGGDLVPQSGRLTYVSATLLKFAPFRGDKIKINGAIYSIPAAGIAGLANTSVYVNGVAGQNLAASTLYRVYVFNNSGVLTADFSTTTHATSTTAGNVGTEIKSGDDTRSLIGMIYTNASAQFGDASQFRLVRTWFNDPGIVGYSPLQTDRTTTSTTAVELNAADRLWFLVWAAEPVVVSITCGASNTGVFVSNIQAGLDGAVVGSYMYAYSEVALHPVPLAPAPYSTNALTEGFHQLNFFGSVSAGTSTFSAASSGLNVRTNGS